MKIALSALRSEKGDVAGNLEAIRRSYRNAVTCNAAILACPEMSFTGFIDHTRFPDAVLRMDGPEVASLIAITAGNPTTLLVGFVEHNPNGKPFVTHIVAQDGSLSGWYRKISIEAEEQTWFAPGEAVPIFQHGPLTFGIAICADIGHAAVFAASASQGAQIVFEVAAPGLYGEQTGRNWRAGFEWWRDECRRQLAPIARSNRIWIPVATQAGRTCDEDFPGGCFLFGPEGNCIYETPDGTECTAYVEIA